MSSSLSWDLHCRVVDNHGDLGVAWRLAADLASRGHAVRLWVDDPSALDWMAPDGAYSVDVRRWTADPPDVDPADVVVETFGCDLPPRVVRRLAGRAHLVWIDLEYLSAEAYVERSHRLPSPVAVAPGVVATRRFFYPGFTATTGGLLRERGLLDARAAFDRDAWLAAHGIARRPGERVASLFCYPGAPVDAWLDALADRPTLLLATPGAPAEGMRARGPLRVQRLGWLTQTDYDRLLWSCDLNVVRGEDSFVRAQWAGAPFVWHLYPQRDGAHAAKLEAFVDRFVDGADPSFAGDLRRLWRAWNRIAGTGGPFALPDETAWRARCALWRDRLAAQPDLTTQLVAFAADLLDNRNDAGPIGSKNPPPK